MSSFSVSCILTGIISLLFGFFVLSKNFRSGLNALWCIVTVSIALWSIGLGLMANASGYPSAVFWLRLHYLGAILIPVFFLHFVFKFIKQESSPMLLAAYSSATLLMILSFAGRLVDAAPRQTFNFYTKALMLYPAYVIFFLFMTIYSHYLLIKEYKKVSEIKRAQTKYLFLGSAIGFLGGSTAFFPVFDWPIFPYGMYLVALYVVIVGYSIVRYRLMDITVVIHKGLVYGSLLGIVLVPAYLAIIISHQATSYSIPPLLAGTLIFACGLWVAIKNIRSVTNVTFSLVCLGVCVWLFGSFMLYSVSDSYKGFFWSKFIYMGVVYIPAFFYHFCESFLKQQVRKKLILTNYLISTAFLVFIPTDYLLDTPYSFYWGYYPKAELLHPLFLVYFVLIDGLSLRKLYLGYKAKKGAFPLEATRIRYVFWAFVIGYTASIDFIQNYGFEFYPAGYLFVSLWVIIVTYAISEYQLLEISLILTRKKVLSYAQILGIIPFYFIVLTLIRLFTGEVHYLLSGLLVAIFSIFARILTNLQKQMEKAVGKALFRKRYDAYQTLTEFTKAIVSILDLGELTGKITQTLSGEIGIDKVSLFILDEKSGYIPSSICGLDGKIKDMKIKADDPLLKALLKKGEIIIKEEMERDLFVKEYQGIVETMKAIEAEISIPFISKGRLVGFCNLGNKKSRDMYSHEDIQLLTNLAHQAAIAIENARLHYLEKKSLILMKQIDKLDTFARFAGGMAHEINNPLVTISTFFQLLPNKRDDEEFMDSFSRLAFTETERIRRLTRELLDYGKSREIRFSLGDVNQLITNVVLLIRLEAGKKKITINSLLASDIPKIHIDPDQIKQVILNMLLNAIDAIEDGGSITIGTRYIRSKQKEEFIQIEVKDTGKGIAKEEIDKIFDPFFTTKHTSREREGTGLGLSISHQIVKEHNGFINVESTLGKGTTFLIYLPIDPTSYVKEEKPLSITSTILDTQ